MSEAPGFDMSPCRVDAADSIGAARLRSRGRRARWGLTRLCGMVVCVLATLGLSPRAQAEQLAELWRSVGFSDPISVSVNPTDGSVWVASTGHGFLAVEGPSQTVMHLAADGTLLSRSTGFRQPECVSANPTDGSCWVAETGGTRVVRLAADGTQVLEVDGLEAPRWVAVDPADGSCWVAHMGYTTQLTHLAADGDVLWSGGGFNPGGLSVNPTDGSLWVADTYNHRVVHLAADGTELWHGGSFSSPWFVSANPADGSCWVADWAGEVVHLAEDGTELWRSAGAPAFASPAAISVDPEDGSCWVPDYGGDQVVHLAADGTELWRGGGFYAPRTVAVNSADGSCWVADGLDDQVVQVASDGAEVLRVGEFSYPQSVAVNSSDGSCWVGTTGLPDNYNNGYWPNVAVVHLSEAGRELSRTQGFDELRAVAVDTADGSCWVADTGHDQLVRLDANGTEAWRSPPGQFIGPWSLSVDPQDGSCWVVDIYAHQLVHLSSGGVELWRSVATTGEETPSAVSVNVSDGSCWVAYWNGTVGRVAEDGTELWRSDAGYWFPESISANSADGSCWVACVGRVVHVAADGTELADVASISEAVAVNPSDGSCWIGDGGDNNRILHVAADGAELWHSAEHAFALPVSVCVNPSDGSCWIADFERDEAVHLGMRAQFSATPVMGPTPLAVSFTDASENSPTSWAWDFGDGETSAERNPIHSYQAAGHHTVTLRASNGAMSGTSTRERYILAYFPDVPPEHWCFAEVIACADVGVVAGYPDGGYHPAASVSRGQMAVYIARAVATPTGDEGVPDPPPGTQSFADVDADHWAYRYVEYAYANSIVQGYWDGTYRPDLEVNRGQMAVYIARALVSPTGDAAVPDPPAGDPTFSDVTATGDWSWCYKHVEYLAAEGIVQGYADNTYRPANAVTRDQMAVYVARAFQLPM
jgi:DNA-binding beta-propeller fold protein YncE